MLCTLLCLWAFKHPVSFRCFIFYGISKQSSILLPEISHYDLMIKDCIHPPLQSNSYPRTIWEWQNPDRGLVDCWGVMWSHSHRKTGWRPSGLLLSLIFKITITRILQFPHLDFPSAPLTTFPHLSFHCCNLRLVLSLAVSRGNTRAV